MRFERRLFHCNLMGYLHLASERYHPPLLDFALISP